MTRPSPGEIADMARDYVGAELDLTVARSVPVAVLLAGQDGSGTAAVQSDIAEHFGTRGGHIPIAFESLRLLLAEAHQLEESDPAYQRQLADDTRSLMIAVRREAIRQRRNFVIVGPLSREPSAELAREIKGAGYHLELHSLATNDQISFHRAASRYERDRQVGDEPRPISREMHDRRYRALAETVRQLEYTAAVDRVAVYNRLGEKIYDAAPVPGTGVAADVLENSRNRMTVFERVNLARNWDEIALSMFVRDAPEEDRLLFEEAIERAHYTLRASPEAAEHYDASASVDPSGSIAYAYSYGTKLVVAYGNNRSPDLMPELREAYAAKRLAMKEISTADPAEINRISVAIDITISDGLQTARAPKIEGRSALEKQLSVLQRGVCDLVESFKIVEASGMQLDDADRRELWAAQKALSNFMEKHAHLVVRDSPVTQKLSTASNVARSPDTPVASPRP